MISVLRQRRLSYWMPPSRRRLHGMFTPYQRGTLASSSLFMYLAEYSTGQACKDYPRWIYSSSRIKGKRRTEDCGYLGWRCDSWSRLDKTRRKRRGEMNNILLSNSIRVKRTTVNWQWHPNCFITGSSMFPINGDWDYHTEVFYYTPQTPLSQWHTCAWRRNVSALSATRPTRRGTE